MILNSLQDLSVLSDRVSKPKMKSISDFAMGLNVKLTNEVVTFDNFFIDTVACFKPFDEPDCEPDFISESGSQYWYGEDEVGDYVVRKSDHWGSYIASCSWCFMDYHMCGNTVVYLYRTQSTECGVCYLNNFKVKNK